MSDAAVIELARLLTEAVQARSVVARDPQTSSNVEQPIGDGVAAHRYMRERDVWIRLAEQRSDELEAAQAQIAELRTRMAELEREWDEARAVYEEAQRERDVALAEVEKLRHALVELRARLEERGSQDNDIVIKLLAESLVARDGQPSALDERRLAEKRGDELKAAQAQINELRTRLEEAQAAYDYDCANDERDEARAEVNKLRGELADLRVRLEEREGDMHLRIRDVADSWRAKVAEVERERDEARAKVIKYESKVERVMRVFTGLVEGHAVTKDDIKVAFDFARSIAQEGKNEEKRDGDG